MNMARSYVSVGRSGPRVGVILSPRDVGSGILTVIGLFALLCVGGGISYVCDAYQGGAGWVAVALLVAIASWPAYAIWRKRHPRPAPVARSERARLTPAAALSAAIGGGVFLMLAFVATLACVLTHLH
jgi:hypothetical protein